MTELKAFIYRRVLDCKRKDVLYYQQEILTKKAIKEYNKEWKINYWYKHIDKVYNYDIILI